MSKVEMKVARRYAKALFESSSPQSYGRVQEALQEFATALQDPVLRAALLNPAFSFAERSAWISDLLVEVCPEESGGLSNFFSLLVQNRRISSLPAVAEFFSAMLAVYNKLLALEVTSAHDMKSSERESLSSKVKEKLPAGVASDVTFDWKTDAELLGGLQIRVGDKLLDGSVSGAINRIARQLRV